MKNVCWKRFYSVEEDPAVTEITPEISKEEFLKNLEQKVYTVPECKEWEELCLSYEVEGKEVLVSIINLTSDISDERFQFDTNASIVLASVRDDKDYVFDYHDMRLRAEDSGKKLTQEEYLKEVVTASEAGAIRFATCPA